jgi:actin-related protein 6
MMDEPYLMEQVKEQACFVSQDVRADLAMAAKGRRSTHLREFVLPDGVHNLRGCLRVGVALAVMGLGACAEPWGCLCRA